MASPLTTTWLMMTTQVNGHTDHSSMFSSTNAGNSSSILSTTTTTTAVSVMSTTTEDNRPIFISDSMREKLEMAFFVVLAGGISLIGSVANIVNMVVFLKQGFADSVNISLFALAVSDFGSLITLVWMAICFVPAFRFHPDIPFETTQVQYLSAGVYTRLRGCMNTITNDSTLFM
ncbi:chemosensory receptor B [Elysia marginata]|uniref:Chemosensory receptor B n=1 Tax=Elysia marginata TaxID=1093978 RepID=A0AAV4IWQ6_9GAST|nr:chemosensory receptor B [Elysia marginata]